MSGRPNHCYNDWVFFIMHRILIAASETQTQEALRQEFGKAGFEVFPAPDGEQAQQIAAKRVPDLIICDINLPKLSAFEFCKGVKNNTLLKDIPIIVLTEPKSSVEDSFRYLGVKDFIQKPFQPAAVLERGNALLGRAKIMHVQKTKILFHCSKPLLFQQVRDVCEGVPQFAAKYMEQGSLLVAKAKEFIPDIVILDLFMADMQADDAIAAMRKVPELANTAILTYYSPISEADDNYTIQAKMIEVQFLKHASERAGATEYLGPLNNPSKFIGLFKSYCKD